MINAANIEENINSNAYRSLSRILKNSNRGFYFVIASATQQYEILKNLNIPENAIYDYKGRGSYYFGKFEDWLSEAPDLDSYFLINFQIAIQNIDDIRRLNFSRDMLARLDKNLIFFMPEITDEKLCKTAFDFYSFVKLKIKFEDETPQIKTRPEKIIFDKSDPDNLINIEVDYNKSDTELLSLALSLGTKAQGFVNDCRYKDALECYKKALEIRLKILGEEHVDTANSYNNVGKVLYELGDYTKALEVYNRALYIREKAFGKSHLDTADSYNNIGKIYYKLHEYDISLIFHNKSLTIREKVLGKNHPDTARTYNGIGNVYYNLGKYKKALEFHNKALAIREKVLGEEHPNTANCYNNIGGVYDKLGEYEKTLEFCNKALVIYEKVLGEEHPDTAMSYYNIGRVYYSLGEYEKALEFYNKALSICEKVLGKDHPKTKLVAENIELITMGGKSK